MGMLTAKPMAYGMPVFSFYAIGRSTVMSNYFVISPNAWNDGRADVYLKYMKEHHVVFMGWDKNTKYGRMFAEAEVGDRVIVAQGANKQKRSYFAGIIDSESEYDNESGNQFTQVRDLRAFVELEEDDLPFSTQCAYGEARLIPALYQLKGDNPADVKIMRRVDKFLNKYELSYTLKEVANWKDNHRVDIPALQRGLVWKPKQVEMLWDSILRGFPIGSFVITAAQNNDKQAVDKNIKAEYFLLDGQQRYNAITLGFSPIDDNSKSALWIDLLPNVNNNSTRKYWMKVTTVAHPWGFANDDNCSVLNWSTCRDAIREFLPGEDPDLIKLQDIKLTKSYPFKARLPILLCDLIRAWSKNKDVDAFLEQVRSNLGPKGCPHIESDSDNAMLTENLKGLWAALRVLTDYRITANVLDNQTIADEDDNTSSLEYLFTRLNTMGSEISPYDLRYSAIKAYWSDIKVTNDKLAGQYMPAPHLAILAFRLALTKMAVDKNPAEIRFADTPSISLIRRIGQEDDPRRAYIEKLYCDQSEMSLKNVLEKIEEKLVGQELPPVLRTSIAINSPDVYLLLMYLASQGLLDGFNVIGLATWIHWFTVGKNKKNIADAILKEVRSASLLDIEAVIKNALYRAVSQGWLMNPIQATTDNFDFKKDSFNQAWRLSQFEGEGWKPLYNAIAYNRELLIYSERRYFAQKFTYDPAQTDFLKGHNRPWDYDHIIPQAWMSRQGKQFGDWKKLCLEWLWNIGNFAAIPFFINRSKGASSCWTEYINHPESLHWDEGVMQLKEELTEKEDMAIMFAFLTSRRLVKIYQDWREAVKSLCDFSGR